MDVANGQLRGAATPAADDRNVVQDYVGQTADFVAAFSACEPMQVTPNDLSDAGLGPWIQPSF